MSDSPVMALDPDAFTIRRETVRHGVTLAFVHEGAGGYPLLLLHGYPETKRIWWRNIAPLAAAGFEVVAPDLRGHGDSDLATDGCYDVAAFSLDVRALMHDVLGHDRYGVIAGDVGGVVLYDHSLRYPDSVDRQCVFNTLAPPLHELYEAAGIPREAPPRVRGRHVRPPAVGRARHVHARRRRVHDGAVRGRRQAARELGRLRELDGGAPARRRAARLRAEPDADARALRHGGPRRSPHLPGRVCGRVHRVHRAVPRPARGPLPPVGGRDRAEPRAHLLLRRPSLTSRRRRGELDRARYTERRAPAGRVPRPAASATRGTRSTSRRGELDRARYTKHDWLRKRVGEDLHADGEPVGPGSERHRDRRMAGEVRRDRAHVVEVHRERVVGLRAERERSRRRRRADQRVEPLVRTREVADDQRADALRLPVVRVVVAGRQRVRA